MEEKMKFDPQERKIFFDREKIFFHFRKNSLLKVQIFLGKKNEFC